MRFLGEIPNTPTDVSKPAKRLAKDGGRTEFCYEAGGCGYVIYRQLTDMAGSIRKAGPGCSAIESGSFDQPVHQIVFQDNVEAI